MSQFDSIDPPSVDTLMQENARLRVAIAHLTFYARAVLECRDNGGLSLAHTGYPAYQASHALTDLDLYVSKVLSGDWPPLSTEQITAAWDRHAKRPLWGEEYLTHDRYHLLLNELLWHPERQKSAAVDLPCADVIAKSETHHD